MNMREAWTQTVADEMKDHGESWTDVVASVPSASEFAREHDFGCGDTFAFTVWTHRRVYFSTTYDGTPGCDSVPRHPSDEATLLEFG